MNTQTLGQALDQLEQSIADRIALYAGEYHAFLGWKVEAQSLVPRQERFPSFHDAYDAIVGQIREEESGSHPIHRSEESGSHPIHRSRLVWDPMVSENFPVIEGTKITTNLVVSLIIDGWTWSDITKRIPGVTEDDIRHCLAFSQSEMNP